jgi:death-on-curing protein
VSVHYLDLTDYLAVGAAVTGLGDRTLITATKLDLADSALHAPSAGFGEQDLISRLCRQGSSTPRAIGEEPSTARWQQACRVGGASTLH